MPPQIPETVTIDQLAALFGVTSRQARNLLEDAKIKPVARGTWALAPAIQAILAHARQNRETSALARARARAVNAQARERELKIARAERHLIPIDDFLFTFDTTMHAIVAELDGAPARITRDVALQNAVRMDLHAARLRMVAKIREAGAKLGSGTSDDEGDDDATF